MGYASSLDVVHVRGAASESRIVDLAREHLLRRHITARYQEPRGEAASEVVEVAREVGADLVVVGRRTAPGGVLGSISSEIVRHAPCDVLVVR